MTIDEILKTFKARVIKDEPIGPDEWINGAARVNALKGTLDNEVIAAEMNFNRIRSALILNGKSNAKAEAVAKSSEEYEHWKKLKAKQDRVIEFIRIAKKRADINDFNL